LQGKISDNYSTSAQYITGCPPFTPLANAGTFDSNHQSINYVYELTDAVIDGNVVGIGMQNPVLVLKQTMLQIQLIKRVTQLLVQR